LFLRYLISSEPAYELVHYVNNKSEDIVLIGFDQTDQGAELIRSLLRKAVGSHIGILFCKQDFTGQSKTIILPFSGSHHDHLAVKWARRICAIYPAKVVLILFNGIVVETLPFLNPSDPTAFRNFSVVAYLGSDKVAAIVEEVAKHPDVGLVITGQIDDVDNHIDVLSSLTENVYCSFLYCSSAKARAEVSPENHSGGVELRSVLTRSLSGSHTKLYC